MGPAAEIEFEAFLVRVEPLVRRALVASYGPMVGRDATVDALSWAWEHWSRLAPMENPVGYLYRVGRTAAQRYFTQSRPDALPAARPDGEPDVQPELAAALQRLSVQQRATVVLTHGYALSQREVAEVLGISVSTVREHLERGLTRLRNELEVHDGH
jgi:RNA polymerase sigma factor (sigma-70 family)